jgi:hypothetical protein
LDLYVGEYLPIFCPVYRRVSRGVSYIYSDLYVGEYCLYSDLYVGEYLPEKQLEEEMGGPSGLPPIFMSDQLDIMAQLNTR